jgi:outer membrane receptor for ferrienterochelin and colicins
MKSQKKTLELLMEAFLTASVLSAATFGTVVPVRGQISDIALDSKAASQELPDSIKPSRSAPAMSPLVRAEDTLSEDLPVVQTAALHKQTLQEAPANVTVISRAEIKNYGYRTLGEAIDSVRGFYTSYDRAYHYVGISGISLPGDFNTRFLVMINGHSMTEHVYDSNGFFGQDFGLDMDLVERIEIIRGSASALYGSNAMLATINVITRSPVDAQGIRVSTEIGSFGERKVSVSDSVYLGKGANLLISGSLFNNAGQTLYIPEFDSPATNSGRTAHSDGEEGFHTFANLVWGDWSFTAYFNSRRKQMPVNWAGDTLFNDHGSHVRDGRNFVEAARSQEVGASGKLRYRAYYDSYRYDDRFDYDFGYVQDQRSLSLNDVIGSEVTWNHPLTNRGDITVGVQGEWEIRNLQTEIAVSPVPAQLVRVSVPDRTAAVFTQQEWRLTSRWKAYGGLRFDRSHNYRSALSPRIALVYQRSASTVFKAVYGSPFRHPSAFEKYFNDNETLSANENLHAERAQTFELSAERKIGSRLTAIVDAYQYRIQGLIQEVFPADNAVPQFQNVDRARSTGLEIEISAKLPRELELLSTASFQHASDVDTRQLLPNSPHSLAKLRLGLPVLTHRAFLSSTAEYMSVRSTNGGGQVSSVFLQGITLTTKRPLMGDVDVQAGIRNLWDSHFDDPTALVIDTIRQDGRSFFLKLIWHDSR